MKRKFSDALQGIAPNGIISRSMATEGFNYCNRLFRLEKKWDRLTPEERVDHGKHGSMVKKPARQVQKQNYKEVNKGWKLCEKLSALIYQ